MNVTETTPTPSDVEALQDLLASRGWELYRELVMNEIAGDFEEHITRALDVQDGTVALDRMRQVAAVRKAGMRWLQLPKERLQALQAEKAIERQAQQPRRRPLGL